VYSLKIEILFYRHPCRKSGGDGKVSWKGKYNLHRIDKGGGGDRTTNLSLRTSSRRINLEKGKPVKRTRMGRKKANKWGEGKKLTNIRPDSEAKLVHKKERGLHHKTETKRSTRTFRKSKGGKKGGEEEEDLKRVKY